MNINITIQLPQQEIEEEVITTEPTNLCENLLRKQINELLQTKKEYDNYIDKLQRERGIKILELKNQIEELTKQNFSINDELNKISTLYREQKNKLEKLEKELASVREQKNKLEKLEKELASVREQKNKLEKLEKELASVRNNNVVAELKDKLEAKKEDPHVELLKEAEKEDPLVEEAKRKRGWFT